MPEFTPIARLANERRFATLFAIGAMLVVSIPAITAFFGAPAGSSYLGFEYNTDDHMVYSAWMRQAMDGHLLMDNRFTTDAQPGLTIHLFFFVLGLLAKLLGIPLAANVARVALSGAFVGLLYRLVRRLQGSIFFTKLAIAIGVVGGGFGFLVWQSFGVLIDRETSPALSGLLLGRLPNDVWQPEGFVFPSMLTSALFMVSLCLILISFTAYLDSRTRPRAAIVGAISIGLLMNIHSYDVLLIGLTMVGFVACAFAQKQLSGEWVKRVLFITLGVVPAALWFVYVLKNDPVFQARAATETFSPNFRAIFFGYLPLMLLAFVGLFIRAKASGTRSLAGLGLAIGLLAAMFVLAAGHQDGYFVTLPGWIAMFVAAIGATVLLSEDKAAYNLVLAWALIGTVAIYFPGLFQRKLTMGLSIPWALLSAYGIDAILVRQERNGRNLVTVLCLIFVSASSLRWFSRDLEFIRLNVSNTTVHPVYLTTDTQKIVQYLNSIPGKRVVAAWPGMPSPQTDEQGNRIPDSFLSPVMPDLNPILAGLTGSYAYAGHWSETPQYNERRNILSKLLISTDPIEQKQKEFRDLGIEYLVAPVPEAFGGANLPNLALLGETVVDGSQFRLIKL
jgi:hypothetical protein